MSFLTEAQRFFFECNGYLVVHDALSPERLREVREACDEAEAIWRSDVERPGVRRWDLDQIIAIMEYGPIFVEMLLHQPIFGIVYELLGPDIRVLDHDYFVTPAGATIHKGWHYDEGFPGVYHPIVAPDDQGVLRAAGHSARRGRDGHAAGIPSLSPRLEAAEHRGPRGDAELGEDGSAGRFRLPDGGPHVPLRRQQPLQPPAQAADLHLRPQVDAHLGRIRAFRVARRAGHHADAAAIDWPERSVWTERRNGP